MLFDGENGNFDGEKWFTSKNKRNENSGLTCATGAHSELTSQILI